VELVANRPAGGTSHGPALRADLHRVVPGRVALPAGFPGRQARRDTHPPKAESCLTPSEIARARHAYQVRNCGARRASPYSQFKQESLTVVARNFFEHRLRSPVIGAPLFIISGPELVIAQCKAGVVGSFPALNARPLPMLEEWLRRIKGELAEHDARHRDRPSAPFAVNQIVHKTNDRLMHDVEMCVKIEVPLVITFARRAEDV